MNTSGEIRRLTADEEPRINELLLSEEQARELRMRSAKKRKNWMRNRPCKCGSGKKFKRCCWTSLSKGNLIT